MPDEITVDDLSDLELFLTPDEVSQVSSAYGAADDAGVRSFIGSEDDRRALEGFLGQAEMLVFQLDKGIASDQLLESMGADAATALGARPLAEGGAPSGSGDPSSAAPDAPDAQAAAGQLPSVMGETIDMEDIRTLVQVGVMSVDELVAARGSLMDALGDSGRRSSPRRPSSSSSAPMRTPASTWAPSRPTTSFARAPSCSVTRWSLRFAPSPPPTMRRARRPRSRVTCATMCMSASCRSPPAEMGAFSEASLITRATNDIQQIQMVLVMCMRMVLFAPCMGVGAVAKVVGFGSTGLQWIIVVGLVVISVVIGLLMAPHHAQVPPHAGPRRPQ